MALKGVPKSQEHRAKLAAVNIGKRHSAETKAKMSAAHMGVKKTAKHAAKISAARKGMVFSDEAKRRMSESARVRAARPEEKQRLSLIATHAAILRRTPRTRQDGGFAGRKHSAESKAKMAAAKIRNPTNYWTGKKRGPMSQAWRDKIAAGNRGKTLTQSAKDHLRQLYTGVPRSAETRARMSAGVKPAFRERMRQRFLGKPCVHPPRQCQYNGIWMRSTFETRVARAFDRLGWSWQYEPERFDLGSCTYLPDFYLPDHDMYVEVKGWYGPNSQRVINAFYQQYGDDKPLAILMKPQIQALERIVALMAA